MKIYFYKKCGVFEAYKKVSDFLYTEGLHGKHGAQMFSVFRYVYLAGEKILARKYGFFKAAAVGAIALVLNDMEQLVAFVAFSHAGNDIYHKLCVLEPCIPNDDGIYILNILGDDQRQRFLGRAVGGMLSGGGVEARNGNACGGGVHRLIIASVTADDLRLTGMYIASVCYCFSPYNFPPINIFCSLGLSIVYIMKPYALSII